MANPPFNVDEIDADRVKTDPRLPFGLPGVNKKERVSNGNYVWISYFYSYLNEKGRAGFVMSSQASSAGGAEAQVRRQLIESGDVDVMISVRSNFFYTRTVPCELWFLNRDKPEEHRDKVLMIDARNVYRKVTRKIYDFSPEQERNLLAIVWLYRGDTERYLDLAFGYLWSVVVEGSACFERGGSDGETSRPLPGFMEALKACQEALLTPILQSLPKTGPHADILTDLGKQQKRLAGKITRFRNRAGKAQAQWERTPDTSAGLNRLVERFAPLAETSRDLAKEADQLYNLLARLIETCEEQNEVKSGPPGKGRGVPSARKAADDAPRRARSRTGLGTGLVLALAGARKAADGARRRAVEQLDRVCYFHRQACWLTERFPEGELRDVEGLVKLVDRAEIEANDWSLTPGRYVGVAPEEGDEDLDLKEALREIHVELKDLNAESAVLAERISRNFEELGV